MNIRLAMMVLIVVASPGCSKTENQEAATKRSERTSEVGAVEATVRELLEKAESAQHLNAYITLDDEGAIARARQLDQSKDKQLPLFGIPMVAKDNIHIAGIANTAGTPALANFTPTQDNAIVAKLKQAGVVFLGKTNLHELAFGITSNNATYGAVANPVDTSTFAGGSSGGTAAAIAAGLAPVGLGTDTGGSVRIPAALTGIVGFRPSTNRYPKGAVTPISNTRDTIGVMARNVTDIALVDAVITDGDEALVMADLAKVRLGVPRGFFYANVDQAAAGLVEETLSQLEGAGVTLVDADIPQMAELLQVSGFSIALYETVRDLTAYLKEYDTKLSFEDVAAQVASTDVKGVFGMLLQTPVPENAYLDALQARGTLRELCKVYFAENDLDGLIFPTTILPARPIEGSMETVELNGEQVPTFPTYIRNTDLGSIAALPGISLPIGTTAQGLPFGMEVDGPEMSDRHLLSVALAIETLLKKGD
ncbi:MAG: indoleacetamide hydrolase [Pseudomonadota bacterium]